MSNWWGIIKEPKKPRIKIGAGPPREVSREMEEDIDAVVEQETKDYKERNKPKSRFIGGGFIESGKTKKKYKGR